MVALIRSLNPSVSTSKKVIEVGSKSKAGYRRACCARGWTGKILKAGSINLGSLGNNCGVNAEKKFDSRSRGREARGLDGTKFEYDVVIY
jgi:hypothetical protein